MPIEHQEEPDGYCPYCHTVGCRQKPPDGSRGRPAGTQLDRIEALQRRIARRLGVEVEGDDT